MMPIFLRKEKILFYFFVFSLLSFSFLVYCWGTHPVNKFVRN